MSEVITSQASKEFSRQLDDTMARWQSKWRKSDADLNTKFQVETLKILKNELIVLKDEIQSQIEIIEKKERIEKNEAKAIKSIIENGYIVEARKRNGQYQFSFWKDGIGERTLSNMIFSRTGLRMYETLRHCMSILKIKEIR